MGFLDRLLGRTKQAADTAVEEVKEMTGRGEDEAEQQAAETTEAADEAAEPASGSAREGD